MGESHWADRRAVEDIASTVDRAVDEKDWSLVAQHFADRVVVDIGALGSGGSVDMAGADVVRGIQAVNPPDKRAYHSRSNVITVIAGDRATMKAHCYGWNQCDRFVPDVYEVWGLMDYELTRIDGDWRITGLAMRKWRESGNRAVNDYRLDD